MSELLKGNFVPEKNVTVEDKAPETKSNYEEKALASIGGSMVFVERNKMLWDGDEEDNNG